MEEEEERAIETGAKRPGLCPINSAEKDEGMHAALLALSEWAVSAGQDNNKEVVLVSCGWARGVNFEVVRQLPNGKKARIVHENLLPTHGHADASQDNDTSYRTEVDRSWEEEDEEVNWS